MTSGKKGRTGKMITIYISLEAVTKLKELSKGNISKYLNDLIISEWEFNIGDIMMGKNGSFL